MVALPTAVGPYPPFQPSPSLWESGVAQFLQGMLASVVYGQTADYRQTQRDLHDMLDGAVADLMRDHLVITHPKVASKFWNAAGGVWHRYLNVIDLLTRTLSVIFHRAPDLYLMRNGARLSDADPAAIAWKQDLKDVRYASVLRQWDKLTTLHRTSFLEVDSTGGKMRWTVRPCYSVRVVQGYDDPSALDNCRAVNVELPVPSDTPGHSSGIRWMTWTREVDDSGSVEWHSYYWDGVSGGFVNPVDRQNNNPYGMYPFVVLRDSQPAPGEFYLPPRQPWLKSQYWVNRVLTDEGWGLHYGMHPTPVLNGWQEDQEPVLDPGALVWSQNSDQVGLQYTTPQLNLELVEQIVLKHLQHLSIVEGLPADFWTGDGSTRNLGALKMQAHFLTMRREDRIPLYEEALADLWNVHRRVKNVHAGRTVYGEDLTLGVSLSPVPYPVDEQAHTTATATRIDLGLDDPIEVIAQERGWSYERAEAFYEKNKRRLTLGQPSAPPSRTSPDNMDG